MAYVTAQIAIIQFKTNARLEVANHNTCWLALPNVCFEFKSCTFK